MSISTRPNLILMDIENMTECQVQQPAAPAYVCREAASDRF